MDMKLFSQCHTANKLELEQGHKPRAICILLTTMFVWINYIGNLLE